MVARLNQGLRRGDNEPVAMFELAAQGDLTAHEDWVELAHQVIVKSFAGMTTEEANANWGRQST
jgi:hypothetical protein